MSEAMKTHAVLAGAGGRIRVQVKAKELGMKDRLADLELIIWGDNLHAPLVERIVELPMDIYGGASHLSTKYLCLPCAMILPSRAFIAMSPGKEYDQDTLHESMDLSRALWPSLKGSSVANSQDAFAEASSSWQ